MLINFGIVLNTLLFIFGLFWCKEVVERRTKDLKDFKRGGGIQKGVIIAVWCLTVVIALLMVSFAWGIARNIIGAFE